MKHPTTTFLSSALSRLPVLTSKEGGYSQIPIYGRPKAHSVLWSGGAIKTRTQAGLYGRSSHAPLYKGLAPRFPFFWMVEMPKTIHPHPLNVSVTSLWQADTNHMRSRVLFRFPPLSTGRICRLGHRQGTIGTRSQWLLEARSKQTNPNPISAVQSWEIGDLVFCVISAESPSQLEKDGWATGV